MSESPIFIKSYELMLWLLQRTSKFPKHQRFLMARRIEDAALDLHAALNRAARARQRGRGAAALQEADVQLSNLRVYVRLAKDLELLAFNQYEYAIKGLDEVGRLLGGWMKKLGSPAEAA
jgi:four helix bundle protein